MSARDWLVIVVLLVVVGAVAYHFGQRRRSDEDEPASRKDEEEDEPEEPPAKPAPKAEPKFPAETKAEAKPPKPAVGEEEADLPKLDKLPNLDAKSEIPEPLRKNSPHGESGIARIDSAEDDEEIDPTRVGAAAAIGGVGLSRQIIQPPVMRILHDDDADEDEPTGVTNVFLVSATAQTDTGLRRKRNEDSLLVLQHQNLFAVADGMGGHSGGEQASKLAMQTLALAFSSNDFQGEPHENLPRQASELARAIQMANQAILERASATPELSGMGTTVCAARFSPNKRRLFIGHVGDSRCYRLRDGVLRQMTADHTMADLGVKGPESKNLSRAVGIWPTVPIDVVLGQPQLGDVYLLCSDGLTKMLPDTTIGTVLRHEEDPKAAVERLILFANAHGGRDNITVILVRVVAPDWKPRTESSPELPAADKPVEPKPSS